MSSPSGFTSRYRGFLLSPATLITLANALLLLVGLGFTLGAQPVAADMAFLAAALIGGAPVFKLAATNAILRRDFTAGFMVSIAMIAALIVGEFSAAALVAFMMLVGEMLENFTMARANNALKELAALLPDVVTVRRDGADLDIPAAQLRRGDIALVRPGGRIPADGVVRAGSAAVDQSAITGESLPIDRGPGDPVYAGTLCAEGALEVTVHEAGPGTALGHMIRLVQEARATQAPVQRVANKYAQYLIPAALSIAALVYLITGEIVRAITVLIVICPCSLVLATPTAVVAAIGAAARRGVLVKNGAAMEQIGKVDVIAFDKTGTLTLGEPQLVESVSLNGLTPHELLGLAAAAERCSEHPIGRAVTAAARLGGLEVASATSFEARAGCGVRAQVNGREVVIGERMIEVHNIVLDGAARERVACYAAHGQQALPVAVDGQVAGLLVVADTVRPASRQAVARLNALGVRHVALISGDNERVANAVGEALGVDAVHAAMLPADKLALIRGFQARGLTVAFVGDGVNDAPALAAADVGIAMGSIGTAVALETADIVLLTDEIERVPDLVELSRATLGTIRHNVIFSMSMNVLSVLLSGLGVIGPVVGAVMHEVSALPVVANSARLVGWRRGEG